MLNEDIGKCFPWTVRDNELGVAVHGQDLWECVRKIERNRTSSMSQLKKDDSL